MTSQNFMLNFDANFSAMDAKFKAFVQSARASANEISNIPPPNFPAPATGDFRQQARNVGAQRAATQTIGGLPGPDAAKRAAEANTAIRQQRSDFSASIAGLTPADQAEARKIANRTAEVTRKGLASATTIAEITEQSVVFAQEALVDNKKISAADKRRAKAKEAEAAAAEKAATEAAAATAAADEKKAAASAKRKARAAEKAAATAEKAATDDATDGATEADDKRAARNARRRARAAEKRTAEKAEAELAATGSGAAATGSGNADQDKAELRIANARAAKAIEDNAVAKNADTQSTRKATVATEAETEASQKVADIKSREAEVVARGIVNVQDRGIRAGSPAITDELTRTVELENQQKASVAANIKATDQETADSITAAANKRLQTNTVAEGAAAEEAVIKSNQGLAISKEAAKQAQDAGTKADLVVRSNSQQGALTNVINRANNSAFVATDPQAQEAKRNKLKEQEIGNLQNQAVLLAQDLEIDIGALATSRETAELDKTIKDLKAKKAANEAADTTVERARPENQDARRAKLESDRIEILQDKIRVERWKP